MRPENDPFFLECMKNAGAKPVLIETEEQDAEWRSKRSFVGSYGNVRAEEVGMPYIDVWKYKDRDQYSIRVMVNAYDMYCADLDHLPRDADSMYAAKAAWMFEE